jgi:hypothetical protein
MPACSRVDGLLEAGRQDDGGLRERLGRIEQDDDVVRGVEGFRDAFVRDAVEVAERDGLGLDDALLRTLRTLTATSVAA